MLRQMVAGFKKQTHCGRILLRLRHAVTLADSVESTHATTEGVWGQRSYSSELVGPHFLLKVTYEGVDFVFLVN